MMTAFNTSSVNLTVKGKIMSLKTGQQKLPKLKYKKKKEKQKEKNNGSQKIKTKQNTQNTGTISKDVIFA